MKIPYALAFTALFLNPLLASAATSGTYCEGAVVPLIKVADFDGSGTVNGKDIAMLSKNIGKKGVYSPLFDRDGNGEINVIDLHNATRTMGAPSTPEDQAIAKAEDPCATATATTNDTTPPVLTTGFSFN